MINHKEPDEIQKEGKQKGALLSIAGSLQDLKEFIDENVASQMKLLKENGDPNEKEDYVNPYVGLITLPHKNFMPTTFQVPHILIGLGAGDADAMEESTLSLRVQCATYGSELQYEGDAKLWDETGYIDLLNMEERIMKALTQKAVIGNCRIDTKYRFGIYNEEITYPYSYGYIEFSVDVPTINRQMRELI